jgi:anti-anti-sigma factor
MATTGDSSNHQRRVIVIRQFAELFGFSTARKSVEDHGFYSLVLGHDHSLVLVRPEIDTTSREKIDVAISRFGDIGNLPCIIDISQLDDLSSDVLTALVRIWKRIRERDGDMVIVTNNQRSLAVLETAQLSSIWNIADTHETACDLLEISPAARIEHRERRITAIVAPWAVLTTILIIILESLPGIETQAVLPTIALILSGLGILCGGFSAFRESGFLRVASVVLTIMAALLATGLTLHRWYPDTYADVARMIGLPDPQPTEIEPVVQNTADLSDTESDETADSEAVETAPDTAEEVAPTLSETDESETDESETDESETSLPATLESDSPDSDISRP